MFSGGQCPRLWEGGPGQEAGGHSWAAAGGRGQAGALLLCLAARGHAGHRGGELGVSGVCHGAGPRHPGHHHRLPARNKRNGWVDMKDISGPSIYLPFYSLGPGSRNNSLEHNCSYTLIDFEFRWGLSQARELNSFHDWSISMCDKIDWFPIYTDIKSHP